MDLSTLNIHINYQKVKLLEPLLENVVYTIRNYVRGALHDSTKIYNFLSRDVRAGFECDLWEESKDRPAVIVFESRFGHDQLAEFDWVSLFAAIAEVLDAEDDSVDAAADFVQKLQQAEPAQKVTCYLRIIPKTATASE